MNTSGYALRILCKATPFKEIYFKDAKLANAKHWALQFFTPIKSWNSSVFYGMNNPKMWKTNGFVLTIWCQVGQWTLMMKVLQFHIWKKYHVMRFFFWLCNILKGLQSFRECFERKIGKSHKCTYFISWSMCQSSDSVGLFKFHQFTSFISVIIPCVIFNFPHFSWKNK